MGLKDSKKSCQKNGKTRTKVGAATVGQDEAEVLYFEGDALRAYSSREKTETLVRSSEKFRRPVCRMLTEISTSRKSKTTRYHSLAFGRLLSADPGECPYCGEGSIEEE